MKRILFGVLIGVLLAFEFGAAVSAKADFAGSWKLDAAKSTGLPPGMEQTMKVTQEGETIRIETTLKTGDGEQTVPDSYVLDGKELDLERGNAKGKRASKWNADGSGFEVLEKMKTATPEGEVEFQATRKWTLAADGKTLTIEMIVKGPPGEQRSTRIFVRQ